MSEKKERKYKFSLDVLGTDTDEVRPSLGVGTTLAVYRLFQFTLRDILEQHYGTDTTDDLFREAGVLAGKSFYELFCKDVKDLNDLVKTVQDKFRELAIGIVRLEQSDTDKMQFRLTVDEDLDCSGLPDTMEQICVYDEGLIQGIFEAFSGEKFHVREIDCWCSGERTCRFEAKMVK